jgi:hypothetical protein
MNTFFRTMLAVFFACGLSLPALADEVSETLQMALEAYEAGDINAAKEEIDYAAQLITQIKAAGLKEFLPDALPGWIRVEEDQGGQGSVAFGGGMSASSTYTRENDNITIQLMADNQMVTAMAGMFGNTAMLGALGQVKRIKRQKVVITQNGELQAMIDNRIFVQISGQAPVEDMEAFFGALDVRGLNEF